MKRDLKNYFGYTVSLETRKRPACFLVALPGVAQFKSKGGLVNQFVSTGRDGMVVKNINTGLIARLIESYHQPLSKNDPVFLDRTALGYNLDIDLDAAMADWNDLLKALRKNGLDLVKGEVDLKVLVIKDTN